MISLPLKCSTLGYVSVWKYLVIHAGVCGGSADLRVLEPGTLPALLKSCPVGTQSIKSYSNLLDHTMIVFALLANSN